jgi:hypothetical protein
MLIGVDEGMKGRGLPTATTLVIADTMTVSIIES